MAPPHVHHNLISIAETGLWCGSTWAASGLGKGKAPTRSSLPANPRFELGACPSLAAGPVSAGWRPLPVAAAQRVAAARAQIARRRPAVRSAHARWMDERDLTRPPSRAELHSQSDDIAAAVVAS